MIHYTVISRFLIALISVSSCIFFTFLAFSPRAFCFENPSKLSLVTLAKNSGKNRRRIVKQVRKTQAQTIENGGNSYRNAKGVMLRFRRWPGSGKKKKFLKRLRSMGLKEKKVFKSFKMWAVNWTGPPRSFDEALKVCKKIENFSFLKYCEPNAISKPLSETSDLYSVGFLVAETTRTEGSKENLQSGDGISGNNVRACGVVSSSRSLDGGRLSDYWAQEMIGSDLLKGELKKASVQMKRNFIAVFDSGSHSHKVGNLILDKEGDHSVLPHLKIRGAGELYPMSFYMKHYHTGYPEDYVKVAEEIKNTDHHPSLSTTLWVGVRIP